MNIEQNLHSQSPAATDRPPSKWTQEKRLEFIDFRLMSDGRFNRSDLVDFFSISVPLASLDISRYAEMAPGNLEYDHSARIYVAGKNFSPIFSRVQPSRYLNELLCLELGLLTKEESFIGGIPEMAVAPLPSRAVPTATLMSILKAIRNGDDLQVVYQSMSKPEPTIRKLSPHALGHDGFRWHVRAFCHKREKFLDFVIARMISVEGMATSNVNGNDDIEWHKIVTLMLGPNPKLSEAGQRVIELDYGMVDGLARLECRQALLYYTLKRLGLSKKDVEEPPESQQIVLKNVSEVIQYLGSTGD